MGEEEEGKIGKGGKSEGKIGKEKRIKTERENVSHAYLPSSTYHLFCFLCKDETTFFSIFFVV